MISRRVHECIVLFESIDGTLIGTIIPGMNGPRNNYNERVYPYSLKLEDWNLAISTFFGVLILNLCLVADRVFSNPTQQGSKWFIGTNNYF